MPADSIRTRPRYMPLQIRTSIILFLSSQLNSRFHAPDRQVSVKLRPGCDQVNIMLLAIFAKNRTLINIVAEALHPFYDYSCHCKTSSKGITGKQVNADCKEQLIISGNPGCFEKPSQAFIAASNT